MSHFVFAKKIREVYDVTPHTLRNWAKGKRIDFKTVRHLKRTTWLYCLQSVGKITGITNNHTKQILPRILYARVSSKKQEADLHRQIEILQTGFPDSEVISDIGSGLDDKRRGFIRLVEKICQGEISEIVVTYKDRLLRFGYDLFKKVCDEHGVRILVYSNENNLSDIEESDTKELQEDLLSIVNVFVARRNGRRSAQFKKTRTKQHEKSKIVPN